MENTAKKVIRRNLPINETYTLIDSFYSSMDNGTNCDNCGVNIANVAIIKNDKGNTFSVGMDCAATLTHLHGLQAAELNFAEAKGIRAKINKALKDSKTVTLENVCSGDVVFKFGKDSNLYHRPVFIQKYLPDWYAKIVNPSKNDFKPVPDALIQFNQFTLSTQTQEAREFYSIPRYYKYKDLTILISIGEGTKSDGTPNGSKLFVIDLFEENSRIATASTYMVRDVNLRIQYQLNKYYFDRF